MIDQTCHLGSGSYSYGNVNIVAPGALIFDELIPNVKIDFWAKGILIENGGSLSAGSTAAPFGSQGGALTIHLYGADQNKPPSGGASWIWGVGITCKSALNGDAPCGIPSAPWDSKGVGAFVMPGGNTDFFYQYDTLPFDDAVDPVTKTVGYFGYKVLAVSYGGTLNLYGKKGALYGAQEPTDPKSSGASWVRLDGTILPKAQTLKLSAAVDWQAGDHIVVTTTDYLASHSEELVICTITGGEAVTFTSNLAWTPASGECPAQGVQWTHYGKQYTLTGRLLARLGITKPAAETRAAVGLLTRSIRIVSEGDALGQAFPAAPVQALPPAALKHGYYFGGHTIVRQGFKSFQAQGVEFKQLGQGGRIAHYPVHFHMVRQAPTNNPTFLKDSSINESMTRWVTVHGAQGVTLARNVGYLSIGQGYYLEDAVETNNNLYSNLGVFARAATQDNQNPRGVPGILAAPDVAAINVPLANKFAADNYTPSNFWITNGWNDFQGNMAAGAGMCGVCFWQLPAQICGPSAKETWESYASEQTVTRSGSTPLKNFDGNFCTSAMNSFQTVGDPSPCVGIGSKYSSANPVVTIPNPLAPPSNAVANPVSPNPPPKCGPGTQWPLCPSDYYPLVFASSLKQATLCPASGPCSDTTAILCQNANETNCTPTVVNNYTTSFNYAQFNYSAVWLRIRWHLFSNSFISDVQNAGLTFVSGGDYTHSSAIKGLWELALKDVFVGQTQPQDDPNYAYASSLSPFNANALTKCDNQGSPTCTSVANSFTMPGEAAFGVAQHMFNIYDGPANEDSNAYLDIKTRDLGANSNQAIAYKSILGIPKAVAADPKNPIPAKHCYLPNAAIGWKQPNGFYYPPNFHSENLQFDKVDIRHLVIVPQFKGNTYQTNATQAADRYCQQNQNDAMFTGFSAVDRQTELSDDDGSLTGYAKTTSVNEDLFFRAPVEGVECESDGLVPEKGTARTSPYQYVTMVVYPEASHNPPPPPPMEPAKPKQCTATNTGNGNWGNDCANQNCYGVPLYREYLTGSEAASAPPFIRMAGMDLCQRETMVPNHGHYFVDTSVSAHTQTTWKSVNVFQANAVYDFFHVFATKDTEQTFHIFVGTNLDEAAVLASVNFIRVDIGNFPFVVTRPTPPAGAPVLVPSYDKTTGVLTVVVNQSALANDYTSAVQSLCVPNSMCQWNGSKCVGVTNGFPELTQAERDATCSHAGADVDCPTGGCVGFSVKMPSGFSAADQVVNRKLTENKKYATCFPKDANWNITPLAATSGLAGTCLGAPIKTDFCAVAGPAVAR